MATIPDSVKATLDAQWAIPTGGVEPTYYVGEDYTYTSPPPAGKDYIWILSKDLFTDIRPMNDTYSTLTHTLVLIVNTTTSGDRLKELSDEVARILNSVAITGANYQMISKRDIAPVEYLRSHQELMVLTIKTFLASSGIAYGAYTTTTFETDELTVNTWLKLGRTVTAILDEDNMVSDSDAALATQQSIKKYADDIGTAAAADVDADIIIHDAIADAHHAKYTNAETDARIVVQNTHPAGTIDVAIDALIGTHNAADTHVAHSGVTITAGVGLSGGGTIAVNRTIDCDITQYTDVMVENVITAEIVGGQSIDNAIDALITTHTADDNAHHEVVEAHADLSDSTLTGPQLEDLLMFGAANAAWVPMVFSGHNAAGVQESSQWGGWFRNLGANAMNISFTLGIPFVKGSLAMTVTDIRLEVADADAAAYITRTRVWSDGVNKVDDTTDYKTIDTFDIDITDCNPTKTFMVYCDTTNDAIAELQFAVLAKCYYS